MTVRNRILTLATAFLSVIILGAFQHHAFASGVGRISGSVLDKRSSEPLSNVNVTIPGTMYGAATDEEGNYLILGVPSGKYRIVASMIGYRTETRTIEVTRGESAVVDFELYPTVIPMGEVIVTATKSEQLLDNLPAPAYVVTKEEIELANIETATQAVRQIPGVYAQGGFGWVKESAKLQGLDPQYTLLLLDGQKLRGAPKYSADLSQFPAEMIERVEVIKGPASALYGSDAMSGVVNVITRTAPAKPAYSASAAFGTNNTRIYKLSHGDRVKQFSYFLSYSRRESDGEPYTVLGNPDSTDRDTLANWDKFKDEVFQGTFGYDFSPTIRLILKPGYSRREQSEDYMIPEQERRTLNACVNWQINSTSALKARVSWFDHKRVMLKGGYIEKPTDIEHELYEAELNYNTMVSKNFLTIGYHYCEEYHTHFKFDTLQVKGTRSQFTNSVFIQDEINFNPLNTVLGVRVDNHDKWGTLVNPCAGLLYRLTEGIRLRGSVGSAFKEPPMCHLYTVELFQSSRWVRANPDLEPEKSWGYQIGVEYDAGRGINAMVSLFRNDIKGMIEQYDTGDSKYDPLYGTCPVYSYKNIDEVYSQGLELTANYQFSSWGSSRLGYTWLESKDKVSGAELFYNPKHKLNLELETRIDRFGLGFNLRGEYIGKRWGYQSAAGCPGMAAEPVPERLDSYSLAHIKVKKEISKHAHLFLSVNNAFDEKYYEWGYREMPGREFLGGLKLKF